MKSKAKSKISARRVGEQEQSDKIPSIRKPKKEKKEDSKKLDSFIGKLYREFASRFQDLENMSLEAYERLFPLPGEVDDLGSDSEYLNHLKYLSQFKKKYARFISVSEKQLAKYKELEATLDKLILEAEKQKG